MVDAVPAADDRARALARRPGEADAGLHVAPVGLHADRAADEDLARVEVEVAEAVLGLGLRRRHHVGQAHRHREAAVDAPGVVDEPAVLLPPASLHRALELVVAPARRGQAEQQARHGGAARGVERVVGEAGRERARERKLPRQGRVTEQVELHRPHRRAHVEGVRPLHHRRGVGVVEHVRAALERREAAVADADEVLDRHARQRRRLVVPEIGPGNAEFARLVREVPERRDVVEHAVVARRELVDHVVAEHVGVRQRDVSCLGLERLVAREAARGPEVGQAGRQVLLRLLDAEPPEEPVVVAQVVVDAQVALVVVERLHRVRQVVAGEAIGERRHRQHVEQCLANRADAVERDGVAGERIADQLPGDRVGARGRRVVDRGRRGPGERLGEDALVHERRRHRQQRRQAFADVVALEAGEEERPITPDRAAQRPAVRVLPPGALLGAVEEIPRVERVVAEELEERALELVLARLAAHQDRRAATAAVLRLVVVRHDLELADGVDVGQDAHAACREFVVVDTVVEPVVRVLAHALCRHRHAAAIRHLTAGPLREEAARASRDRARAEQRQLDEIAAVERQLSHLLGVDDLAQRGVVALQFDLGDLAGHRHFGRQPGDLQREVERQARLDLEHDLAALLRLEAGHRRADRVGPDRQQGHRVTADAVGDDLAHGARALVARGDDHAGNCRLLGVHHGARDGAHRLREDWGRRAQGQGHDERRNTQPRESHAPPACLLARRLGAARCRASPVSHRPAPSLRGRHLERRRARPARAIGSLLPAAPTVA